MDTIKSKKNKRKNDIILLVICLGVGIGILAGYKLLHRERGASVVIKIDGEEYTTLPLSEDTSMDITGVDGGTNHLVIQNGEAAISDADCPDKLCVHQSAISHNGESLVCLPHKVIVTVSSESSQNDFDALVK